MMRGEEAAEELQPWYKGYTGEITPAEGGAAQGYVVTGRYEVKDDDILEITELPIGKWTRDYKSFLEDLAGKEPPEITDIREYHAENRVHFVLEVPGLDKIAETEGGILKKFKLQSRISCRNMVAFSPIGKIVRYT